MLPALRRMFTADIQLALRISYMTRAWPLPLLCPQVFFSMLPPSFPYILRCCLRTVPVLSAEFQSQNGARRPKLCRTWKVSSLDAHS